MSHAAPPLALIRTVYRCAARPTCAGAAYSQFTKTAAVVLMATSSVVAHRHGLVT